MLKQMKRVIAVLLILVVMTGCVTMEYDVKVNRNGSADLTYIMALDNSVLSMVDTNGDPLSEAKTELTSKGFTVEDYKTDKMFGIKAYKNFKDAANMENLEDLLSGGTAESTKEPLFNITDRFFIKKYKFDAKFDLSDMAPIEGGGENAQINNAIISNMDMSFKLTTPTKPIAHNAQTVEDKYTLIWKLKPGEINNMTAEFNILNILNIILTAVGVGVIVAIITIIEFRKRNKDAEESVITAQDMNSENDSHVEEANADTDTEEPSQEEETLNTDNSKDIEENDDKEDPNTDDLPNSDNNEEEKK